MIILGIDPGVERVGFAVLKKDSKQASKVEHIHSGTIVTKKSHKKEQRFLTIYVKLESVVRKYRPDCLIIEELFYSKNTKTAIPVAQAQGIVYLVASKNKLPVYTLAPNTIKLAVTGYGNADKHAIKKMIDLQISISKKSRLDDEYDAIACAFTYLLNN